MLELYWGCIAKFFIFHRASFLAPMGSRTDSLGIGQQCTLYQSWDNSAGSGTWWFGFSPYFYYLFFLCLFNDCRQKKEELSQRIAEERARREEEEARRQEAEKQRRDAEEREKEERLRRQAEEREQQKEKEEMERIQKQVCFPLSLSGPV